MKLCTLLSLTTWLKGYKSSKQEKTYLVYNI